MPITQVVERRFEMMIRDAFQDARTVALYSVALNVVAIPTVLSGSLCTVMILAIAARRAAEPGSRADALRRAARVVLTIDLLLAGAAGPTSPSQQRQQHP